jgi:hypothetical protein
LYYIVSGELFIQIDDDNNKHELRPSMDMKSDAVRGVDDPPNKNDVNLFIFICFKIPSVYSVFSVCSVI